MFMPKGTDEILAMIAGFLVYFLGIPAAFMLIIKKA